MLKQHESRCSSWSASHTDLSAERAESRGDGQPSILQTLHQRPLHSLHRGVKASDLALEQPLVLRTVSAIRQSAIAGGLGRLVAERVGGVLSMHTTLSPAVAERRVCLPHKSAHWVRWHQSSVAWVVHTSSGGMYALRWAPSDGDTPDYTLASGGISMLRTFKL